MKKLLSILLAAVLCTALLIPVGAENWISTDLVSQMDDFPDWVIDADVVDFEEFFEEGKTNAESGSQSGFGYVYLKEHGLGDFSVPFTVSKTGVYNIGVMLMAWSKSVPRSTEFKIDDSEWIYVCYDYTDEDQYSEQYLTGLTMYLTEGDHTFTLSLADDFDNTAVKSLYFDNFFYSFVSADKPVAEAPVVEEPAVEEPVVEEPAVEEAVAQEPVVEEPAAEDITIAAPVTAPQTFDIAVIAAVSAVLSLAGYAVAKKR